jgi:flagellar basal-body rod modification protein FlgD
LNGSSSSSVSPSNAEEIQNRFLTLLVAQLENQDPLNPLDNTQITNQLSQMSTVSGIEQINQTLSLLVNSLSDAQAVQASALVGKTVLVPGANIGLVEGEGYGGVNLAGPADTVNVEIHDASGRLVATQSLGPTEAGNLLFSWDGTTTSGEQAADGAYSFKVSASSGGVAVSSSPMQLGMVSALSRAANGNFMLDLGSLGKYNFDQVQQVF